MPRIYFDTASITPIDPRVERVVIRVSKIGFANPSSIHNDGVVAKKILDASRASVASFLNTRPQSIIFTASGTEANNLAIVGTANALISKRRSYTDLHMVVSSIEHTSVLECARFLEKRGVAVDYVAPNEKGIIEPETVKSKLRANTFLVSVQMVNNEIGTIQAISLIAKSIRIFKKNTKSVFDLRYPLLHTDACQAALYTSLNTEALGVDLLTLDSQKVYGPRAGLLFIKKGIQIEPIIFGGGQEFSLRSGTENVPAIAGFAEALLIAKKECARESRRLSNFRETIITTIQKIFSSAVLNGDSRDCVPHIINFSFPNIDTEFLTLQLDARGIAVATKSSCLRHESQSYVVQALKKGESISKTTVRISLGRFTKKSDLVRFFKALREIFDKNR